MTGFGFKMNHHQHGGSGEGISQKERGYHGAGLADLSTTKAKSMWQAMIAYFNPYMTRL